MTENKRFTYSNTYGWHGSAFLKVMNGLDEKNKELKERIKQQEELISEQAIQIDFLRDENKHMRQVLEENRQLKQFKELFCAVLKQEYEDRTNEMNRWAEKEDWNGYRATKLEYGTVIRIAKRIGVDLDD